MKTTKSGLAQHAALQHPKVEKSKPITFLKVIFLESVRKEEKLILRCKSSEPSNQPTYILTIKL